MIFLMTNLLLLKDKDVKEKAATYVLPGFLKLTHCDYTKLY